MSKGKKLVGLLSEGADSFGFIRAIGYDSDLQEKSYDVLNSQRNKREKELLEYVTELERKVDCLGKDEPDYELIEMIHQRKKEGEIRKRRLEGWKPVRGGKCEPDNKEQLDEVYPDYEVISNRHLRELVAEVITKRRLEGWKVTGGIQTYTDTVDGRLYFCQAIYK